MRKLFLLMLVGACSFDGSNTVGGDGGVGADAGTDPDVVSAAVGYEDEFEAWPVPASGTDTGFSTFEVSSGSRRWFVADMTGDGLVDLVQTADPSSSPVSVWKDGEEHSWRVFSGGTTGFAATGTVWSIPVADTGLGYFAPSRFWDESWELRDLNADGCPDLVLLTDPATGAVWEDEQSFFWKIHFCGDGGFETTATSWQLPDQIYERATWCTMDDGCWDLQSLTGDGLPDLVHSSPGSYRPWDLDGSPHWRVHAQEAGGFATEPIEWAIPENESQLGFFRTRSVNSALFWSLLDLDKDGALELVQTAPYITNQPPAVFAEGAAQIWKRFVPEDSGFSTTHTPMTVPAAAHAGGFYAASRADDVMQWSTIDIDGDGHLDLVHTANSAADTPSVWGSPSSDQWKVYLGNGSSFSSDVTSWHVPDSTTEAGFYATELSEDGAQWSVMDLDGDGVAELVQAADPATGEVWRNGGDTFWRVYRVAR